MNGPFNITIPPIFNRSQVDRQIRSGVTTSVVEEFAESRADRLVSTNIAQSMRARDILVTAENFKPNTPYFIFFDGINVNSHVTPTSTTYGMGGVATKGTAIRSDNLGKISVTFSIPNTDELSFTTGEKALKITDSSSNSDSLSMGSAVYSASGTIRVMQEEITSTRNGRVITDEIADDREQVQWVDPLAQSFLVDKKGGIFVPSVEVFFGAKDTALPVTIQIRHMENGFPTQKILPFGEKTLVPADVNISADATVATKFSFPSPVFLESGREYCAVVMTNSNVYTCWVSEMGQKDIATNDFIDRQPYAGTLFKSQNNSTWTADQLKDLKMTLNRCKFTTGSQANLVFENGVLPAEILGINPIETLGGTKCFRVYHYSHGNYDEKKSNITITGVTGDRTGSIFALADDTINRTGSGSMVANTQTLSQTATSGSGVGAIASIATTTTASTSVIITDPGSGFAAGDTVAFTKDGDVMTFTIDVVKDTLGGIPVEYINRTHSAGTSDAKTTNGTAKILADMDSYLITIPTSVWPVRVDANDATPNCQAAVESASGGGESVTATGNIYFDTIHTTIPSIELPNTSMLTTFRATSATQPVVLSSPANSFTKDSVSTTITLNDNNALTTPKIVASSINEANEMGGAKSLETTIQMSTTSDNVSPILDTDTLGMIAVQNRINNVDAITDVSQATAGNFDSDTDFVPHAFTESTEPKGDSNAAVYITKKVTLTNPANAIHVLFDGYRAHDSNGNASEIEIYFKTLGPDTNIQFTDVGWTEATIKTTVQADASDFKEYVYEIESLEDFNTFSIKVVMQSDSSSNIPLMENFRAIALST